MQYLGVFCRWQVQYFYFTFFRGRCSPSHTHIHINRTLANFFPDTLLTSGGFHPKPIYETNFANNFWCSSFNFSHRTITFQKTCFQTFWQPPLTTPNRHEIYEPNSPIFFYEIHPKFSYNHFLGNYMKTLGN